MVSYRGGKLADPLRLGSWGDLAMREVLLGLLVSHSRREGEAGRVWADLHPLSPVLKDEDSNAGQMVSTFLAMIVSR